MAATSVDAGSTGEPARSFGARYVPHTRGERGELRLSGRLTFAETGALWSTLAEIQDEACKGGSVDVNLEQVELVDGGAMALLANFRAQLQERGVHSEFVGASVGVHKLVHLYGGDACVARRTRRRPRGMLDQLGTATMSVMHELQLVLAFFGQMVIAAGRVLRKPRSANWKEVPHIMEGSGADALPIVLLTNFLVGLVMAYQASAQLKRFGANILVADLIGISVTRELGPLMTAIIVCGRSGAAFAAELGSMRVNEEIDALRTLGLGPMPYLVLPRALSLMVVMPLLTLLSDIIGIVGGLIVALVSMDLTSVAYLTEVQKAVKVTDPLTGLLKSVVFGLAIALISCQQGLAATGGAEEVGRRTTSAVVITLFSLIVLDAVFTVAFRAVGF